MYILNTNLTRTSNGHPPALLNPRSASTRRPVSALNPVSSSVLASRSCSSPHADRGISLVAREVQVLVVRLDRASEKRRRVGDAVNVVGRFHTGQIARGWQEVVESRRVIRDGAGRDGAGPARDQRHPDSAVVHGSLDLRADHWSRRTAMM